MPGPGFRPDDEGLRGWIDRLATVMAQERTTST